MGEQKFYFWINVIVGPVLGGFLAYFITASILKEFSWCIVGEEHCVRNWVSALSGWAAATAAGLTIVFLHRADLRRELLEWRETVNSAELLRGHLATQVQHFSRAIQLIEDVQTPEWMIPCLERIERLLLDPTNQEVRRASVIMAARLRACVLMVNDSKSFAVAAKSENRSIGAQYRGFLGETETELRGLLVELAEVRESAFNPKQYRGI